MLVLARKVGQSIMIDENIEVIVQEVTKDGVKLAVVAPKNVKILRKELIETTTQLNQEALNNIQQSAIKAYFKQVASKE